MRRFDQAARRDAEQTRRWALDFASEDRHGVINGDGSKNLGASILAEAEVYRAFLGGGADCWLRRAALDLARRLEGCNAREHVRLAKMFLAYIERGRAR